MYLSKVWVDWNWARDPYQLHRALWQLFPDRPEAHRSFLFRVEQRHPGQGADILLQSEEPPETSEVALLQASKPLELGSLDGARLRFCLRANPIKTIRDPKRKERNGDMKRVRVPLIYEDQQLAWLARKLDGAARLNSAAAITEIPLYFRKNGVSGKIQPVRFEGVMEVVDTQILKYLLRTGIGPAKAMGCGLLSLAPS